MHSLRLHSHPSPAHELCKLVQLGGRGAGGDYDQITDTKLCSCTHDQIAHDQIAHDQITHVLEAMLVSYRD